MTMLDDGEVQRRLGYHPATEATTPAFELNRTAAILLAEVWNRMLPPGREAALALTALQEALMWANAAVACNAGPDWQLEPVDVSELLDDLTERLEGPLHLRSRVVGGGGPVPASNGGEIAPVPPVPGSFVQIERAPAVPVAPEHCTATAVIGVGARTCDLEAGHDGQHTSTDSTGRVEVMWG